MRECGKRPAALLGPQLALVCAVGGAARQDAGLSLVNHMYSFHAWRNVTMTPTMAMATMTQSVPGINARPAGEQSGLHRQGN